MSWIATFSGNRFWPLHPTAADIRIEDIAHALSNICRFTGHCREFYSVAEHSVHVSRVCDPKDALWGLLHDASEAYICDVARPIKPMLTNYRSIEHEIMLCVCERFGLDPIQPDSVTIADDRLLATEARDLLAGGGAGWTWPAEYGPNGPVPLTNPILPVSPSVARYMFAARLVELGVR